MAVAGVSKRLKLRAAALLLGPPPGALPGQPPHGPLSLVNAIGLRSYLQRLVDLITGAQALASDKRLLILKWLKDRASYFGPEHPFDEEEGVCGLYIAQKPGISAAATSTHLKIRTVAGLIRPPRVGKFTYFRRVEPAMAALAERIAAL